METQMKSGQRMRLRRSVLATAVGILTVLASNAPLRAQQDQPQRNQYAGMEHVAGQITAISGSTVTVKTEDDQTRQIVATTNTRIMRNRTAAKLVDLKVGDGVAGLGNLDGPNGTLHAAMLFATDAEQTKVLRENLGKTYIRGKVTAIDMTNATITVERPDHVSQTIGLDETTSFRKGTGFGGSAAAGASPAANAQADSAPASAESITLADIKIGDRVQGVGALKAGVFVPAQLTILLPGTGQGPRQRTPAATPPPS
jgi:hypothetical protein